MGCDFFSIRCPLVSMSMLGESKVKCESQTSPLCLFSTHVKFLSSMALVFQEPSDTSAHISVDHIKEVTFFKALAKEVCFCLARRI